MAKAKSKKSVKAAVRGRRGSVPGGTRAIVLAGGRGTRLRPYTTLVPKPLVPIGERAILEYVLRSLKRSGFSRVTLCVGHQAELIAAFFGDGKKWGVSLDYSIESKPLSTIGPLGLIEGLSEDFLVMNGDLLTDLDLSKVFAAHRRAKADLTVAVHQREVRIDYGVLRWDTASRRIKSFTEKPTIPYDVSMGIYVLNRRCLEFVERNKALGFDELIRLMLRRRRKVMAYPYRGRWLDVGRPEDYELAQQWDGRR